MHSFLKNCQSETNFVRNIGPTARQRVEQGLLLPRLFSQAMYKHKPKNSLRHLLKQEQNHAASRFAAVFRHHQTPTHDPRTQSPASVPTPTFGLSRSFQWPTRNPRTQSPASAPTPTRNPRTQSPASAPTPTRNRGFPRSHSRAHIQQTACGNSIVKPHAIIISHHVQPQT